MVEGVNKASQPGASAIGRRIRFTRAFHSASVSAESRFSRTGRRLKSVTGWIRQQNAIDVKSLHWQEIAATLPTLCPDGHLWVVCRATEQLAMMPERLVGSASIVIDVTMRVE